MANILQQIQAELKVPKNQFNKFGGYKYRSAEDIQEALKPLLNKHGYSLTISDDITQVGDRIYLKALIRLLDPELKEVATTTAFAREPLTKKGSDESQITGAASSYARKYALSGMFLLDDTKDADGLKPDNDKKPDTGKPSKPEKKDGFKEYLEKMSIAKKTLNEMTGSDEIYYAALGHNGVEHANQVNSVANGEQILNELRSFVHNQRDS